jgi:hypothetical protein
MDDQDPIKIRSEGSTPHGGVASEIYYYDDDGNAAPRSKATRSEIVELDAKGNQIYRIHGTRTPSNTA